MEVVRFGIFAVECTEGICNNDVGEQKSKCQRPLLELCGAKHLASETSKPIRVPVTEHPERLTQ